MLIVFFEKIIDGSHSTFILVILMPATEIFVDIDVFYNVVPMLLRMQNTATTLIAETKKPGATFFDPVSFIVINMFV